MASGYGFKVSDWTLIALIAIGGYFAYTTIFKPASKITGSAADVFEGGAGVLTGFENLASTMISGVEGAWQTAFSTGQNVFKNMVSGNVQQVSIPSSADVSRAISIQTMKGSAPAPFANLQAYTKYVMQHPEYNVGQTPSRNIVEHYNQLLNAYVTPKKRYSFGR